MTRSGSSHEEQAAKTRYYQELASLGINVPADYFGDEQKLSDIGWHWRSALIVRVRDGSWRMSYRSFCYWYQSVNLDYREEGRLLVPPTPIRIFQTRPTSTTTSTRPATRNTTSTDGQQLPCVQGPQRQGTASPQQRIPGSATVVTAEQTRQQRNTAIPWQARSRSTGAKRIFHERGPRRCL